MTAYLQYQCNICFTPITGLGAATLLLTQSHGKGGQYHIITDTNGLSNPDLKDGEMVSHICPECLKIIATRYNKKDKDV